MGYYQQGDYYATGGIFDVLKKVVGGGLKVAGAVGSIAGRLGVPFIGAGGELASGMGGIIQGGQGSGLPMTPRGSMLGPGTMVNGTEAKPRVTKDGRVTLRKRPRMDYGNVRALRRADRRIDGFVGVAKKALTHTNYKVVSRSAGTRRRTACGSCNSSPCKCG